MFFNCPVCGSTDEESIFGSENISCPRCGKYQISSVVAKELSEKLAGDKRKIANASGWIREHQRINISSETIETLVTLEVPSLPERAFRLLKYIGQKTSYLGERIRGCDTATPTEEFYAVAWAERHEEFAFLIKYLQSRNFLDGNQITPEGYSYLEQAQHANLFSQIGFCAMWFDNTVKPIWTQAILPAMSDAGYEPKRIDEHHHNNRIDDEIIALIRRSKFVVADFTGQRGGVYFEAGFALGMNLPVIWTVKKSELGEVHFDNRQYNFVVWEENNLPEFKLNLQYRIEATLGRGTWMPNA